MKDVADWLARVAHSREQRTVEDHLPLDSALGREEGGRVQRELQGEWRCARQAAGRAKRGRALDGEQHARVRSLLSPAMVANELVLERVEPGMCTGIKGVQ